MGKRALLRPNIDTPTTCAPNRGVGHSVVCDCPTGSTLIVVVEDDSIDLRICAIVSDHAGFHRDDIVGDGRKHCADRSEVEVVSFNANKRIRDRIPINLGVEISVNLNSPVLNVVVQKVVRYLAKDTRRSDSIETYSPVESILDDVIADQQAIRCGRGVDCNICIGICAIG